MAASARQSRARLFKVSEALVYAGNPTFAEGHGEIGHFDDDVMLNSSRARHAFREAARIRKAQNI